MKVTPVTAEDYVEKRDIEEKKSQTTDKLN